MPFHCVSLLFVFSFNDLLIDDTPNNMMNASNNSTRPNESSADELDDDEEDEDAGDDRKKQNGANGTDVNSKTLLVTLMKQINLLHETNSKIFRNLHETKGKWVTQDFSFKVNPKLFC